MNSCVCDPSAEVTGFKLLHPAFCRSPGHLNSCPHACVVDILLPEPLTQPLESIVMNRTPQHALNIFFSFAIFIYVYVHVQERVCVYACVESHVCVCGGPKLTDVRNPHPLHYFSTLFIEAESLNQTQSPTTWLVSALWILPLPSEARLIGTTPRWHLQSVIRFWEFQLWLSCLCGVRLTTEAAPSPPCCLVAGCQMGYNM